MPLIHVLLVLVGVGVLLWLVNTYLPMDAKIKKILNIVVVIVVVLWLLRAFGILDSLSGIRVGRLILAGHPCFSEQQEERRANMNEDILKGKWNEIKGGVKEKWGKLTEDDLTQVEGNQEKLLGLLQQKYGYAKDKAEQEYNDFIGRYKGK